jgi:deoxyribodipyrimidine photo-lyase
MSKEQPRSIFWFRRDLRLEDNAGLYRALKHGDPVLPLFIFDKEILDKLPAKDARVLFIHQEVSRLKKELEAQGSTLLIKYGNPLEIHKEIFKAYTPTAVFTNRDYEPYAQQRDKEIYAFYKEQGVDFTGYKDHVLLEKNEVLKDDGDPYVVYTPYMKTYKSVLTDFHLKAYPNKKYASAYEQRTPLPAISLKDMGFESFDFDFPSRTIDKSTIKEYHKTRDIPAIKGTTRLSLHLRFGTISIRALAKEAKQLNEKYFNELIWRDFYQSILYHFPKSLEDAFRPKYDEIKWENNEKHFEAWCAGKTGYPLVDAGMRELNETGFMHNRVRMLVASFLTKHLLIDWRWGETYFAEKLLDYEAASNVGGWQWAAGSGVDAAPYFRIFNPTTQLEKFDKDLKYVKKWVKEYGTDKYPKPIVEHKKARERALERYKDAVG